MPDADLTSRLDGNRKALVGYNLTLAPETVRAAAGKLAGRGLLAAEFSNGCLSAAIATRPG